MNDKLQIALVTPKTANRVGKRIALSEIENETIRYAIDLWNRTCADRIMPSKAELGPRELAGFLRSVTLFKIFGECKDFEYRIVGDAAVVAFGYNFKGLRRGTLNELQPGMGDVMFNVCNRVWRTKEPLAVKGWLQRDGTAAFFHEAVFLPLGDDHACVDHVLCVGAYDRTDPLSEPKG
jgi:hypothetical protein